MKTKYEDEKGIRILASKPLFGRQAVVVCENDKEIRAARRLYAKVGIALSLREPLISERD